jgi:hypothetical protein
VRSLLVSVLTAAILAAAASAGAIDPRTLVLRQSEVSAGFVLDRQASHATPNSTYTRPAGLREVVARSGRVTGYVSLFRKGKVKVISSGVDLYHRPAGARMLLSYHDAQQRRYNKRRGVLQAYGRERAGVGSESWVYWSGYPGYYVLVVWRYGRILGAVQSWDLGREPTLRLARLVQKRIAAALR